MPLTRYKQSLHKKMLSQSAAAPSWLTRRAAALVAGIAGIGGRVARWRRYSVQGAVRKEGLPWALAA